MLIIDISDNELPIYKDDEVLLSRPNGPLQAHTKAHRLGHVVFFASNYIFYYYKVKKS